MSRRWMLVSLLALSCVAKPKGASIVPAPAEGGVAEIVADRQAAAAAKGRQVIVYVGATWCEPCRELHDAVLRGELDETLAGVDLLEFDRDRDEQRLEAAGCTSTYIPLLARPTREGRCSDLRIEGSIKGADTVRHLSPRLRALLGR